MSREHARQAGRKQHVRHFFHVGTADSRSVIGRGDLHQRTAQAGGIAGELHGGRVGQRFAGTGHRRLNQATEEQPHIADDEHRKCRHHDHADATASFLIAATARSKSQHGASKDRDGKQAEQQTHQPDVQAHIAVEDVTELVGDDPLQFRAIQ